MITRFFIQANAIHFLRANQKMNWPDLRSQQPPPTQGQVSQQSMQRLANWARYEYNLSGPNVEKSIHYGVFLHSRETQIGALPHASNVLLFLRRRPGQFHNLWILPEAPVQPHTEAAVENQLQLGQQNPTLMRTQQQCPFCQRRVL